MIHNIAKCVKRKLTLRYLYHDISLNELVFLDQLHNYYESFVSLMLYYDELLLLVKYHKFYLFCHRINFQNSYEIQNLVKIFNYNDLNHYL